MTFHINKSCGQCGITKPTAEFGRRGSGFVSECRSCARERSREYRKNNPEKAMESKRLHRRSRPQSVRESARRSRLRANFGITTGEYATMLNAQNGTCQICKGAERSKSKGGEVRRLAVDHCHSTGAVRGLLCHACNWVLGKFNDNIERFKSAIEYLEHANSRPQNRINKETA